MKIVAKIAKREKIEIGINTPFIKLDSFLKFSGIAETGAFAKQLILDEKIKINGEICTARGKKIKDGDVVSFLNMDYQIKNEN